MHTPPHTLVIRKSDTQAPTSAGAACAALSVPMATSIHSSHAGTHTALSPQFCSDAGMELQ